MPSLIAVPDKIHRKLLAFPLKKMNYFQRHFRLKSDAAPNFKMQAEFVIKDKFWGILQMWKFGVNFTYGYKFSRLIKSGLGDFKVNKIRAEYLRNALLLF